MSGSCDISADAGAIRSVLGAVDCNTRDFAQRGYEALTGGQGFQNALTAVLTIYIALVGYRLLFARDGARLADGPRTALKVGVILALVTSWTLFQTLVFDVAARAPAQIAALISTDGSPGSAREADPVGRLQVSYDQLSMSAVAFGKAAGPATAANASREAAAARALTAASGVVLIADAGLIAATTLLVGVLTAIGPLFVTLFLFQQTRGLFVGWVRSLISAAIVSLGVWVLIVLMLGVLEPWLVTLAQQRELNVLNVQSAMTAASIVFIFCGAQIGMVIAGLVIALGFRLNLGGRTVSVNAPAQPAATEAAGRSPLEMISRAGLLAEQLQRLDRVFEGRERAAATGSAAASMRLVTVEPGAGAGRANEAYRRPVVRRRP
jgi:type IV secretion system protein VirB6